MVLLSSNGYKKAMLSVVSKPCMYTRGKRASSPARECCAVTYVIVKFSGRRIKIVKRNWLSFNIFDLA